MRIANLTAVGQSFGEMTDSAFGFSGTEFDGIAGLAWPVLGDFGTPLYDNLVKQNQTKQIFSFALRKYGSVKKNMFYLGGWNAKEFTGNIQWVKLATKSYWTVPLGNTSVGTRIVSGGSRAIIDTGTSLILTTPQVANTIHALIGARISDFGLYSFPCSNLARMPLITIRLGTHAFQLRPTDYTLRYGAACYSGFMGADFRNEEGLPTWIIGDVFLRKYYSIYDIEKAAVGFAVLIA